MTDTWTEAKLAFEREITEVAAHLLEAGRGPPAECLTAAKAFVIDRREKMFRAKQKLHSKIVVIEGGKRRAPKVD